MTISVIFAWLAVLALVLSACKFLTKKNKRLNRIFRKIHIPAGLVLLGSGLVHGLLAGNAPGAGLGEISIGSELFSLNAGTICFLLAALLGLNYCLRKQLRKAWLKIHRVLTVLILVVLVIHVAQTGITLPQLFHRDEATQTTVSSIAEDAGTAGTETAVPDTETNEATEAENTMDEASETEEPAADSPASDEAAGFEEALTEEVRACFSGATLQDGTYEGSGEGFKGTIEVSVTVENGAVTAVNVLSEKDTPQYWNRASVLTDTIVSEQSLEVDAVSGATYSSKGILCAVYDALQDAVLDGELQISIPETQGRRH